MTVEWYHTRDDEFTYVFNLNKLKYHLTNTSENYPLTSVMTFIHSIVNQTNLSEEYYFYYMKVLLSHLVDKYPDVNIISHFDNSFLINNKEYNLSCIYPIECTAFNKDESSGDLRFEIFAIDLSRADRSNFHLFDKNEKLNFNFKYHKSKALVYIEFIFTEKDLTENKDDRVLFDYLLNYYEFEKRLKRGNNY